MILFSPAKINLGLHIKGKQADGFHSIESILYPVPLHDIVEFLPASEFSLTIHGRSIPGSIKDNSISRVYQIMKSLYGVPGLEVHLLKNIPPGSGLGGASSNASSFINGINEFFNLCLSIKTRQNIAAQIGSDCPFFIQSVPTLVTGKGDILKEIEVDLKGYFVFISYAKQAISTAWAYKNIIAGESTFPGEKLMDIPLSKWQDVLSNDFEGLVFEHFHDLSIVKTELLKAGAVYSSLSGSGSVVFGIFEQRPLPIPSLHDNLNWCFKL